MPRSIPAVASFRRVAFLALLPGAWLFCGPSAQSRTSRLARRVAPWLKAPQSLEEARGLRRKPAPELDEKGKKVKAPQPLEWSPLHQPLNERLKNIVPYPDVVRQVEENFHGKGGLQRSYHAAKFSKPVEPTELDKKANQLASSRTAMFAKAPLLYNGLWPKQDPTIPEVAVIGRSNVGKSSLLNRISQFGTVAKVSCMPGQTKQAAWYRNRKVRLDFIDMPGYGHSARAKVFGPEALDFVRNRTSLQALYVLVDARHGFKWSDHEWLSELGSAGPMKQVILTKCDMVPMKKPLTWSLEKGIFGLSQEVQPLLPTAAIMSLFCSGCSLEETSFLCLESMLGTAIAVLNAAIIRLSPEVHQDLLGDSGAVMASVGFVAIACLLPLSESAKMYTVGLTAYFTMDLLKTSNIPILALCMEYMAVSLAGSLCALFALSIPLPGLPDARAYKSAAAAFHEIAEGCAEVITEATEAFLGTGAGDAWRALAQQRLLGLAERLAEAKSTAEYQAFSPLAALRQLLPFGSMDAARQLVQQEAAFEAAGEAMDVCSLLCEFAARPHGVDAGAEAALVTCAAEATILRVAQTAAALLKDLGRSDFLAALKHSKDAAQRKHLREAAQVALQDSSINAAQELMHLQSFQTQDVLIGNNSFANARSEMASVLFLIHDLASCLLQSEATSIRKALRLERRELEEDRDIEDSTWSIHGRALYTPLLGRRRSQQEMRKQHNMTAEQFFQKIVEPVKVAAALRWRCAFKVTLTYSLAFMIDETSHFDSVLVCTVSYLCSYGSQYAGGSLRRAISRGVGVSAGATVGSVLQRLCFWSADEEHWEPSMVSIMATLCLIFAWSFLANCVNFRGGPYSYVGFCAAFTAIKFLSCAAPGSITLSTTITSSMYACLLAVLVETCILPVDARDLLQGRVTAALLGIWAVLPVLVTTDQTIFKKVKQNFGLESFPDLTDRLKQVGAYDKYLEWREGYMRWRQGQSCGARGEIEAVAGGTSETPSTTPGSQRDFTDAFIPKSADTKLVTSGEASPKQDVHLTMHRMPPMPETNSAAATHAVQMMPSLTVLLSDERELSLVAIQDVLNEIHSTLAPLEELTLQAAERLDGLKIDGNAWSSLADRLRIMRLWLCCLSRIVKRLGHGCSLADLLGDAVAAEDLLMTVGSTIAAAARAVIGATAPRLRECTKLEARLRSAREGLFSALTRRRVGAQRDLAHEVAEVLALSAGHALVALVGNAARCLALAVRMAPVVETPHVMPRSASLSASGLPDLTERLKQQGQYDKYIKWREGYMKWRSGGIAGSKGEVVEGTTT
ncbi:unnamed protein product [Effrenium voratum]|nr:unnamed protein product [Effrenium voratum]